MAAGALGSCCAGDGGGSGGSVRDGGAERSVRARSLLSFVGMPTAADTFKEDA